MSSKLTTAMSVGMAIFASTMAWESADRHQVVRHEHGIGPLCLVQQFLHGQAAAQLAEVGHPEQGVVNGEAAFLEGLTIAEVAPRACRGPHRAGDTGDPLVAARHQVADRLIGPGDIVHDDAVCGLAGQGPVGQHDGDAEVEQGREVGARA